MTGMMETVRIRRSGYPVRREFKDFLFRYGVLGREVGRGMEEKQKCVAILRQHDTANKDWQLGKTKVHVYTCTCMCTMCVCVCVCIFMRVVYRVLAETRPAQ